MYFGFASKLFGAKSFVLSECCLDPAGKIPVRMVGRRRGVIGWIMSLLRLEDSVTLEISSEHVVVSRSSLNGTLREEVPMSALSNLGAGYLKPLGFLYIAVTLLPVIYSLTCAVLDETSIVNEVRLWWQLTSAACAFVASVGAYFLRKCVVVHVIAKSGYGMEVAFSRSMIEGIVINQEMGNWTVEAIMATKFGRSLPRMPEFVADRSADNSRTWLVIWVSAISVVGIGGAMLVARIAHGAGCRRQKIDTLPIHEVRKVIDKTILNKPRRAALEQKEELQKRKEDSSGAKTEPTVATETVKAEVPKQETPKQETPKRKTIEEEMILATKALLAKDYSKAIESYGRAAEKGDARAFHALGQLFRNNLGVEADPEAAVVFFRAAVDDVPQANAALAECFETGYGVGKNPLVARSYYRRALEMGDRTVKQKLADLEESAKKVNAEISQKKARQDLEKAEKACENSGYQPLEMALRTLRSRLHAKGIL